MDVEQDTSDGFLLDSKRDGGPFTILSVPLDGKTLREYVKDENDILEGLWSTDVLLDDETLDGMPALRSVAQVNFPVVQSHVIYSVEHPTGTAWQLGFDFDGTDVPHDYYDILCSFHLTE